MSELTILAYSPVCLNDFNLTTYEFFAMHTTSNADVVYIVIYTNSILTRNIIVVQSFY